jgi:hypothetical protein
MNFVSVSGYLKVRKLVVYFSYKPLLLTYILHGAGYYLKSWFLLSLSKNIYSASLRNPKVHYRAHKSPPLDPILC